VPQKATPASPPASLFTLDDLALLAAGGPRIQPGDVRAADADYVTWRQFADRASLL
jgi:hypothetical protein